MNIREISEKLELMPLSEGDMDAQVSGCYIGDLLSLVMSRAQEGEIWLTVQTNVNIVAVAVLTGVACVVVTEGMDVPEETVSKAAQQGVTLLKSPQPSFALARALCSLL